MSDQSHESNASILALQEAMERLEARVASIEGMLADEARPVAERLPAAQVESDGGTGQIHPDPDGDEESSPTLAEMAEEAGANIGAGLIGGILLVLAGAFLLRSLTEGEVLPRVPGIALGLLYALGWAAVAHVMGRRGRRGAASAGGLAASMVALPIIWESTVRFHALGPWPAAGMLMVVGAIVLLIAECHRLAPVSAAAVLGVGGVSMALMFGTRRPEPFFMVLAVLAVLAIPAGTRRGGPLPWLCYLLANVGALLLVAWSAGDRALATPSVGVALLVAWFAATTVVIIWQSGRTGTIGPHHVFQGIVATLLGFGGGLLVASDHLPVVAGILAAVGMVLGVGGYAFLLFTFRWSRQHRWPFLFHSSLALVIVAMCSWTLLSQPAWLFAALAALLAVTGVRLDRVSPGLHAAMAVVFAALVGELGGVVFHGLVARGDSWPGVGGSASATLIVAVLCACLPLKDQSPVWPAWLPRLGRGVVILVAVLGIDAVLVRLAASWLAGEPGALDPGTLATLRTGILAASVVLLAGAGRYPRFRPARRLVWPLLAMIGLKLLVEDFPRGRAITMAVALLLSGVGLILAAALLRRESARPE